MFASILALFGGLYFWGQKDAWLKFSLDFFQQRVEFWFYLLPLIWMVFLVEFYDLHRARDLRQTVAGIALAALAGLLLYALIYLISPKGSLPRLGNWVFPDLRIRPDAYLAAGIYSDFHCPGIPAPGAGNRCRQGRRDACTDLQ